MKCANCGATIPPKDDGVCLLCEEDSTRTESGKSSLGVSGMTFGALGAGIGVFASIIFESFVPLQPFAPGASFFFFTVTGAVLGAIIGSLVASTRK